MKLTQVLREDIIKNLLRDYPNKTWETKLRNMSDAQLWAILQRKKRKGA
jgi:hypothetical protein